MITMIIKGQTVDISAVLPVGTVCTFCDPGCDCIAVCADCGRLGWSDEYDERNGIRVITGRDTACERNYRDEALCSNCAPVCGCRDCEEDSRA